MKCKNCGTEVEENTIFCPKCGMNVHLTKEQACPFTESIEALGVFSILKLTLTKKYGQFQGRSTRKEWWIFTIAVYIVVAIATSISSDLAGIVWLLLAIPQVALWVRRLHDVGKSGWWVVATAVPIIDLYVFYLVGIKRGSPFYNEYGPAARDVDYIGRR